MKLDNEFYKLVLRVANDEVKRLESEYVLSEKHRQEVYAQAVSAATMICYHNELCEELKKYNIDIHLEDLDLEDSDESL